MDEEKDMSFEVDYFTLGSTDATFKRVVLSGTVVSPTNVAMDLIGGTAQALYGDFTCTDGSVVRWSGLGLDSTPAVMTIGEKVRVIYDRS